MDVNVEKLKTGLAKRKGKGVDYTARMNTRNQNELKRLQEAGLLDEFLKYQDKPGFLGTLKNAGSGALDILNRSMFATAGAIEETYGGDPGISGREALAAGKRVGREMLSGIGGLKGDKKTISEVAGEKVFPEYGKFQKEHPYISMATDLGIDILADPSTYPMLGGGKLIKGAGKLAGKGFKSAGKALRATKTGEAILDTAGTAFVPGYRLKRGVEKAVNKEAADVAYNTFWQIGHEAQHYGETLTKNTQKTVNILESKAVKKNPEIAEGFLKRIFYGEGVAPTVSKEIEDMVTPVRESFKVMAETEKGIGKLNKVLDNYFPNNPKQISEFLENVGDFLGSGRGGGALMNYPGYTNKEKVFRNADELLQFFYDSGLKRENLGQVLSDLIKGRTSESVKKLRQHMVQTRMVEGMPDVFMPVPFGTKHFWDRYKDVGKYRELGAVGDPIVLPGNVLYMPKGNLSFFPTDLQKAMPASVREILENGGEISAANLEDVYKLLSNKKMVGVTSKVKAYQAPKEVIQFFDGVSKRLAAPDDIIKWWDSTLNFWKNTAILSPFFHARNLLSSGAQNYVGDVGIRGYKDALKFMSSKGNLRMYGRTVAEWTEEMGKHGINIGGFVGQQVGKSDIPVIGKVFDVNRQIGSGVEELSRAAMFFDRVRKGKKPLEAALDVKKFHFDYGELTDFEKRFMKRLFPFYSWTRHNIPLQLEMMMRAPNKYRNLAKLKRDIAGAPESDGNPDWWKDQDVWEIKGGNWGYHMGLPYSDLNMQSPMGLTGPLKTAVNVAYNYDDFTKQPIDKFKGDRSRLIYALEGAVPAFKRYGIDIMKYWKQYTDPETPEDQRKAKWAMIKRLTGLGVLPKVKSDEDRQRIYNLREALDEFDKYMEAGGGQQW